MAAATKAPSPKGGVLDEIEELRQTLQDYEDDITEKRAALAEAEEAIREAEESRNATIAQMQEKLDSLKRPIDNKPAANHAPTAVSSSGPTPKYGNLPTPKAAAPTPKGGQPTQKGNSTPTSTPGPKKSGKAKGGKAKGKGGMTCAEAVWDVLDRDPAIFKELLEEYPDDANGLKPMEVKEIILKEKKWESSGDPAQQIHAIMGQLRYEGKLGRDNASRYYPIKNAELYGPALNSDGSPMTLLDDGTFKMKDGRIFYWQDGKTPVPQRKRRGKRADEEGGSEE